MSGTNDAKADVVAAGLALDGLPKAITAVKHYHSDAPLFKYHPHNNQTLRQLKFDLIIQHRQLRRSFRRSGFLDFSASPEALLEHLRHVYPGDRDKVIGTIRNIGKAIDLLMRNLNIDREGNPQWTTSRNKNLVSWKWRKVEESFVERSRKSLLDVLEHYICVLAHCFERSEAASTCSDDEESIKDSQCSKVQHTLYSLDRPLYQMNDEVVSSAHSPSASNTASRELSSESTTAAVEHISTDSVAATRASSTSGNDLIRRSPRHWTGDFTMTPASQPTTILRRTPTRAASEPHTQPDEPVLTSPISYSKSSPLIPAGLGFAAGLITGISASTMRSKTTPSTPTQTPPADRPTSLTRPLYVFRIDNLAEIPDNQPEVDAYGTWRPSTRPGSHILQAGGTSGRYWTNGEKMIMPIERLPEHCVLFKTYSMYYSQGFWITERDASGAERMGGGETVWRRLSFDYDDKDCSSYLTSVGEHMVLRTQRPDQQWPGCLLPNIYHAPRTSWASETFPQYGGLKGDLPVLLGLIAFSIAEEHVAWAISNCFALGQFKLHPYPNGWVPKRGMVIRVWAAPNSSTEELEALEEGDYGPYFS